MHDALWRARRPAAPLAAVAAVLAFSVGVALQGRVLLHDCVSTAGAFGSLGLRLDVLRDATDCPAGSYGLGGVPRGAVLLFSVALPVLVAYALLTACGVGLSTVVARAVRQARALLRAVLPQLTSHVGRVPEARSLIADARPVLARSRVLAGAIARRGPPLVVA